MQPDQLSGVDVLLLKGDADPRTRAVMTGVLLLDEAPEHRRLLAAFERATRLVPRMRQRVLTPALPVGPPVWADDPEFDVRDHVHRIAVLPSAGLAGVLDIAAAGATASFDMARPLWEATVVHGVSGGRAALMVRTHHSVTDGLGAIAMLGALVSLDSNDPPPIADDARVGSTATVGASQLLLQRLTLMPIDTVTSNLRRVTAVTSSALRFARSPRAGFAHAQSARRLLSAPDAPPSPLLAQRSRRREYAAVELPLDALRDAARRAGCTVNDAYLAGVLGGYRHYQRALGDHAVDVPLALPISIRDSEMLAAGNHFSAARLAGPATISDPVARMQRVHELVAGARNEPALGAIDSLAELARHVPDGLARVALRTHARHTDLQASNLMGTPVPIFVAGAPVDRIYPFGPLPGVPVMTVLLSYCATSCIGITLDPAAVTDPALFVDCVRRGFDEVVGRPGTTGTVTMHRSRPMRVASAQG